MAELSVQTPPVGDVIAQAKDLPAGWAVYYLVHRERLSYVGLSNSPLTRVMSHVRGGRIPFDRYFILDGLTEEEAKATELELIQRLMPPYNRKDNPAFRPVQRNQPIKKERFVQGHCSHGGERFVGVKDVAAHLSTSVSTIYQKVAKGDMPHYRDGRTLRFRISEMSAIVTYFPTT